MKLKILIAAAACIYSLNSAKSQTLQVIYEMQTKIQLNSADLDKSIIDQIMKSSKAKSMLCYNNGESVFRPIKEDKNSSGGVSINISVSEDITYKNHNTNKEISYKNFLGKEFLIESDLTESEFKKEYWEITDSVKDIQGYACKKAVLKDKDGKEIKAWFCPGLPINDGPAYTGLDGLVMEMEMSSLTFVATEILFDTDCQITVPTKGKKTDREDYDKMVKKRLEAMEQGDDSSSGGIVIKIIK